MSQNSNHSQRQYTHQVAELMHVGSSHQMTSGTGQSYYRSYLPNAIHSQWGEGNEYQSFQ